MTSHDTVEPMATRTIDPCPVCSQPVDQVENGGANGGHIAQPCGHRVTVTIWPNRYELT